MYSAGADKGFKQAKWPASLTLDSWIPVTRWQRGPIPRPIDGYIQHLAPWLLPNFPHLRTLNSRVLQNLLGPLHVARALTVTNEQLMPSSRIAASC